MADAVTAALNRTATALIPRFQQQAMEMGWPEDLARSLTIQVGSVGNLMPTWPKNREQEVLDMEAGTIGRLPRPVIHSFFSNPDSERSIRAEMTAQSQSLLRSLERRIFS